MRRVGVTSIAIGTSTEGAPIAAKYTLPTVERPARASAGTATVTSTVRDDAPAVIMPSNLPRMGATPVGYIVYRVRRPAPISVGTGTRTT